MQASPVPVRFYLYIYNAITSLGLFRAPRRVAILPLSNAPPIDDACDRVHLLMTSRLILFQRLHPHIGHVTTFYRSRVLGRVR